MKKVLALLLASLMVFSLAACGKDQTTTDDSQGTTSGDTGKNGDSKATYADLLAAGLTVDYATSFSDGVALIQMKNGTDYTAVAIDTAGNVLFEKENVHVASKYKNGIWVNDDTIYDKTGKAIASPEMSGYDRLLTPSCNGYVLVYKEEETSSGTQRYIGVLNNKGEWEHPLSTDNPFQRMCDEERYYNYYDVRINYLSDNLRSNDLEIEADDETALKMDIFLNRDLDASVTRYYNAVTNELTKDYDHYATYYIYEKPGIWWQEASGTSTEILASLTKEKNLTAKEEWFFENAFVGVECQGTSSGIDVENGIYKIYDYSGNVITDLSGYKLNVVKGYVNGYLLATVDNGDNTNSLCLFTPSGELAFEPINGNVGSSGLDEEGFVYWYTDKDTNKTVCRFCDYSGNVVEYTNVAYFYGFSDGLALVKGEDGTFFYISHQGEAVIK